MGIRSFLTLASVAATASLFVPEGEFCGAKSLLTYEAKVTWEVENDHVHLRIDGEMHWSWCTAKMTELDENNNFKIVLPGRDSCYARLLEAKTGGVEPELHFDPETQSITVGVKNINYLPSALMALYGSTIDVELTGEDCVQHGATVPRRHVAL